MYKSRLNVIKNVYEHKGCYIGCTCIRTDNIMLLHTCFWIVTEASDGSGMSCLHLLRIMGKIWVIAALRGPLSELDLYLQTHYTDPVKLMSHM